MTSFFNSVRRWLGFGHEPQYHKHLRTNNYKDYNSTYIVLHKRDYYNVYNILYIRDNSSTCTVSSQGDFRQ